MVSCLSTLSIRRSKHAMHWMLCLLTLSILVFVALTQGIQVVWVENLQYRMKGIEDREIFDTGQRDACRHCWSRFIPYCKCTIEDREIEMHVDTVEAGSSSIANVLLKTDRERDACWHCQSRFIQYCKCTIENRERCMSTLSIQGEIRLYS